MVVQSAFRKQEFVNHLSFSAVIMAAATVYMDGATFSGSGKKWGFGTRMRSTLVPQANTFWSGVSHAGHSRGESEAYQDEGSEDPSNWGPPGAFRGSRGGVLLSGDARVTPYADESGGFLDWFEGDGEESGVLRAQRLGLVHHRQPG